MNFDVISEMLRLFVLGVRDVFYGIYQYHKNFKSDDTKKDKPSNLQLLGLSTLKSLLFWIVFLNVILFGLGHKIMELILAVIEYMVLKVCGSLFPESSQYVWSILYPSFAAWFPFLWIFPLFVVTRIVNYFWFQDIADLTRSKTRRKKPSIGAVRGFADLLYTWILEIIFLVQCSCLSFIPDVGFILSTLHLALLYSMYVFEYKWGDCGMQLPKRIEVIQCNWPYFLGFGLPLALVTSAANSYIWSLCVFSFLFPLCIISGNSIKPSTARHRYRFPVFTISVFFTNKVCELVVMVISWGKW